MTLVKMQQTNQPTTTTTTPSLCQLKSLYYFSSKSWKVKKLKGGGRRAKRKSLRNCFRISLRQRQRLRRTQQQQQWQQQRRIQVVCWTTFLARANRYSGKIWIWLAGDQFRVRRWERLRSWGLICRSICCTYLKVGQSRPLFVYSRYFLNTISIIHIEKSVDGVVGIWTRGRMMVGADKTIAATHKVVVHTYCKTL